VSFFIPFEDSHQDSATVKELNKAVWTLPALSLTMKN
jgi:hypothetical protein